MSARPRRVGKLALAAAACAALSLACRGLPAGRATPLPNPATAIAGATASAQALQGLPRLTPTLRPSGTPMAPPSASPAASPHVAATPTLAPSATPTVRATQPEGSLPRLASAQPVTVTAINMLDTRLGWAVAHSGGDPNDHVLRTADGGQTWGDVSPPQPAGAGEGGQAVVAVFLDDAHAWAVYFDPQVAPNPAAPSVWATRDGGQTWALSPPLDVSEAEYFNPAQFAFAGDQHGWLLAHVGAGMSHDYVMVYATADGGATWERVVDPFLNNLPMSCAKTGIGFLNAQTGWITGDCQGVTAGVYLQRSDDGGHTWNSQALPAPAAAASLFESEDHACRSGGLQILPPQSVRLAVSCTAFDTGTETSYLYASGDAGQSWQVSALPGPIIHFLTSQVGWAQQPADPNQPRALRQVFASQDAGQTWTELSTVAWSGRFDFVSPEAGWAVAVAGDTSALVASTDGGRNWRLLAPRIGP